MSKVIQSIRNKELDYANNIYMIAYLIIVVKALYAYSDLLASVRTQMVLNICNAVFLAVLAYKMVFLQKYRIMQIFICILAMITTEITDYRNNVFMMLANFFLVAALQDVDFKKVIKYTYKIEAVVLGIHAIIYPVLYVFNRQSLRFTVRGGETAIRHQFLMSHANIFSMLLLWTILGYIYVNYENLNIKKTIGCWLIYVFFYFFTDSNSGLIILTIVTMLILIKMILGDKIDNLVTFLARYLYIILFVIFDFLMIIFPYTKGTARELWLIIDDFFTGRPKYGAYAYYLKGFTLFGQSIDFPEKVFWQGMWFDGGACDNAYMWISVSYGLAYIFIIGFMFWKYGKRATFVEKIIMIAYSLYTMMELYVGYIFLCFGLLVVGKYMWESSSEKTIGRKLLNARKQKNRVD